MANVFGFIGLGLIGGSICRRIKANNSENKVIAFDVDRPSLLKAQLDGDVDVIANDIDDTFSCCDYIFLCAPVAKNMENMELIKPFLKDDAILTDVGSTKHEIMQHAAKLGLQKWFIGGHPMAGSERTGYASSTAHLLENAFYILTPFAESAAKKTLKMVELVHSLAALPMVLDGDEHDRAVATVSHLPHVIAFALVNTLKNNDDSESTMKRIAAGGFRDITRIASSSPEMWESICRSNKKGINDMLDIYEAELEKIRTLINNDDRQGLLDNFRESGDFRHGMDDRSVGSITRSYALTMDIPDVAGSIAGVLNILHVHQITIKNLGVLHSRDYGEAALKIDFYDDNSLNKAIDVLTRNEYSVYKR